MKKILLSTVLTASLAFAQSSLNSILENVSIPKVNETIKNAKILQKDLNEKNFLEFLKSWKEVEALYFAGDINEDYLDTPRYIDVYHNLKENLNEQMKRVVASKDEPNIALFKNSFKTINALEYVLFNDKTITKREKELAVAIINSIISNLSEINEVYKSYKKAPKNEKWENGLIINTLIASSYRLKEWRIGDAAGLSVKYKGDKDNRRGEYYLSKNSFNAIKAILHAHASIIDDKDYYNFATMAKEAGAQEALKEAQNAIVNTLNEMKKLKKDDFTNAKSLFESSVDVHNAYYLSLIEELSVTAKILDADGD